MAIPPPIGSSANKLPGAKSISASSFFQKKLDNTLDIFSADFDCTKASASALRMHDACEKMERLFQQVMSLDPGAYGEQFGYNNIFFTGFTWIDDTGQNALSTLAARPIGQSKESFYYSSSVANAPINSILIGDQLIPISRITGVFSHHPSNMIISDEAKLPLPTRYLQLSNGTIAGDYHLLRELSYHGAPAEIILGVSAEKFKGTGYNLFAYSSTNLPDADQIDRADWENNYGRQIYKMNSCYSD